MSSPEQRHRESQLAKERLNPSYPVTIVGAGISGIALSRRLTESGIDHCLVDAEKPDKAQSVHYLTTETAAASLGLLPDYYRQLAERTPITGYARYDATQSGLVPLESLAPSRERPGGFVTLTKLEIKKRAAAQGVRIHGGMALKNIAVDPEKGGWNLEFADGQTTSSSIVVDATGSKTRVARLAQTILPELSGNRTVRACYGAVLPYLGPEDTLIFADKYPPQEDFTAREGAGWVMPVGNKQAEVVVGWEMTLKELGEWQRGKPLDLLRHYADWFNQRGIPIDIHTRTHVVSGTFSQEPLDFRKLNHESNLFLFGESLGLNHPLNGYLISNIDDYARIMAEQIAARLRGENKNPYTSLFAQSSLFYGPQIALSRRKMAGARSGEGRSAATSRIQELLVTCLSPDGLWRAIDSGVPVKELIKGLMTNPKFAPVMADIGIDYLTLLMQDDLYFQELALKLKEKVKHMLPRRNQS